MVKRVILHVGAMKSGTSYLQSLLMQNKSRLGEHGIVVPGTRWAHQVAGVSQVLERKRTMHARHEDAWQSLVDEMTAHDATSVLSMEFLGPAALEKMHKIVDSFPGVRVEVVITARDLGRGIPAMWQEHIKNGGTISLEEYAAKVRSREQQGKRFWREQSIAAMADRWSQVVGADAVTIVTVPPPGGSPEVLWHRFAETLGIDAEVAEQPPKANESLGAASVEVLRQLNVSLSDMEYPRMSAILKHRLAKKILSARRAEEPSIGFEVPDWLIPTYERMMKNIVALGVPVIGDLEELRPLATRGIAPDQASADDRLAAAMTGMDGLVRTLVSVQERHRTLAAQATAEEADTSDEA